MSYIIKDKVCEFLIVTYVPLTQEKNQLRKNSLKGAVFPGSPLWAVECSLSGGWGLAGFRHQFSTIPKDRCVWEMIFNLGANEMINKCRE